MVDVKKTLVKILATIKKPIKIVRFKWVCSSAVSAGGRLIYNASPSNSSDPVSVPAGYTFVCWVQFMSVGWVGAIYPENPDAVTTSIFTATAKSATSNESVQGIALYVRSDLA